MATRFVVSKTNVFDLIDNLQIKSFGSFPVQIFNKLWLKIISVRTGLGLSTQRIKVYHNKIIIHILNQKDIIFLLSGQNLQIIIIFTTLE